MGGNGVIAGALVHLGRVHLDAPDGKRGAVRQLCYLSGRFVIFPIIALELPHAEPAFASVVDGSGLLRVLNAVAMGEK